MSASTSPAQPLSSRVSGPSEPGPSAPSSHNAPSPDVSNASGTPGTPGTPPSPVAAALDPDALRQRFRQRAEAVGVCVSHAATPLEAMTQLAALSAARPARENLIRRSEDPGRRRVLAVPDLEKHLDERYGGNVGRDALAALREACTAHDIDVLDGHNGSLREHCAGIELGAALAEAGIADTGTCLVASTNEEVRLATMLSEVCVLLVPRLLPDLDAAAPLLRALHRQGAAYSAMITGSSRTSDIERVLTLGVHGPLELHLILLGDA